MDMYYYVEPVFPGLTRIKDVAQTGMYLIEGTEKALVLDTGVGVGDLRRVVEQLTDKPITVVITHGHVDHAMGAGAFAGLPVYMNPKDIELYKKHCGSGRRKEYVQGNKEFVPDPSVIENLSDDDYLAPLPASDLLPLTPGDSFDLGGVTVEILDGAGHTPGAVVAFIPQWRLLFTGDACCVFTLLMFPECPPVEAYRETLLRLKEKIGGRYDRVLSFHGGGGEEVPDVVEQMLAICDEVLAGTDDHVPMKHPFGDGMLAKAFDVVRRCRVDGGAVNLAYDPERLRV